MEQPPFNYPNPLGHMGGVKQVFSKILMYFNNYKFMFIQIRAEAAYLYDAVHLYARTLIKMLESNENPKNGTAFIDYIKGTSYLSAMG